MNYVERFERLGFGMFVHFGLYSMEGAGEWYFYSAERGWIDKAKYTTMEKYRTLASKFKVKKSWAKELVKLAKNAGCKYITLTTRHHDGFSLYDTCGLSDFDAPHSRAGRDLVREFVDECRAADILPVFYHTLLDWNNPDYEKDFPTYIDYLVKSIEILCTNYGKIGGLWFDGKWDKPDADWQEDRLFGTIRRLQPEAMIINNTGLHERGKLGHPELDSVTFERGRPCKIDTDGKHIAGEMCEVLNDHWGYAEKDINYKPMKDIIESLIECRYNNCNFLLNLGPLGNGSIRDIDSWYFKTIGKWIKANRGFIYNARRSGISADGAYILTDGEYCYAVTRNIHIKSHSNVGLGSMGRDIILLGGAKAKSGKWLDTGRGIITKDAGRRICTEAFSYGTSMCSRVAKFKLK